MTAADVRVPTRAEWVAAELAFRKWVIEVDVPAILFMAFWDEERAAGRNLRYTEAEAAYAALPHESITWEQIVEIAPEYAEWDKHKHSRMIFMERGHERYWALYGHHDEASNR